jgi:radical SAM protein with 4Fe4S-binding SPASM domain
MYKRTEALGNIHQKTLSLLSSENEKNSYLEYRKKFEDAASFKKIHKFPIHLDIELDNVCNYACTFCPIGQPENKLNSYYKDIKKLDEIKVFEILDEAKSIGVRSIQFNLVNEPLAHKNIFKILEYANNLKFDDIFFISNGYLLNESNTIKILNSGLKKIMFSLDAFSPQTYKQRRLKNFKEAKYEKVINNILNFLDIKKKQKKYFPLVRVSFIIMESNKHEVEAFRNFWSDKVDAIHFQKLIDYTDSNIVANSVTDSQCNMPMFRLSIKSDGNVKPCCVGYGEDINIGNIYKESLFSIWNSKFMKNFQEMQLKKEAFKNEVCKKCLKNSSNV